MMAGLLNAARLFQTLLDDGKPIGSTVAGDLDTDSFDDVPFVTHSETIAQDRNSNGLWTVTLSISMYVEPSTAFDTADAFYTLIQSWGEDPTSGVVPGVGGVEAVEDLSAFTPITGDIQMGTKAIRQYVGAFTILARSL